MTLSVDELIEDIVHTARHYYETSMRLDKPFDNNWQEYWFHLLLICEAGEVTAANGRIINPQRKIAESIAKRIIHENDLILTYLLSKNLGKTNNAISEEDKGLLNYLSPRSVIPFSMYVEATEKARGKIIEMMKEVKQAEYQRRGWVAA